MRLLGIDFGGAKIGVAVAESSRRIATPRQPIKASGRLADDAAQIVRTLGEEAADQVVLGLPLDAEGETKMSRVCRQLGALIEGLGTPVAYVDESLTSHSAETEMLGAGLKGSQRRKSVDGESACRILERYLESHAEA